MSVKNDLKSLRRKVQKLGFVSKSGLSAHELKERSLERARAALLACITGEEIETAPIVDGELEDLQALSESYSAELRGARETLKERLLFMADNRREEERRKRAQKKRAERDSPETASLITAVKERRVTG